MAKKYVKKAEENNLLNRKDPILSDQYEKYAVERMKLINRGLSVKDMPHNYQQFVDLYKRTSVTAKSLITNEGKSMKRGTMSRMIREIADVSYKQALVRKHAMEGTGSPRMPLDWYRSPEGIKAFEEWIKLNDDYFFNNPT